MDDSRCYMCGRSSDDVRSVFQPLVDAPKESELQRIREMEQRTDERLTDGTTRYQLASQVMNLAPDLLKTDTDTFIASYERMKSMYVGTDIVMRLIEMAPRIEETTEPVRRQARPVGARSPSTTTIGQLAATAVQEYDYALQSHASIPKQRAEVERKYKSDDVEWIKMVSLDMRGYGPKVLPGSVTVPLCLVCASWKHEVRKAVDSISRY